MCTIPRLKVVIAGLMSVMREKMAKGLSLSHDLLFPWAVCT